MDIVYDLFDINNQKIFYFKSIPKISFNGKWFFAFIGNSIGPKTELGIYSISKNGFILHQKLILPTDFEAGWPDYNEYWIDNNTIGLTAFTFQRIQKKLVKKILGRLKIVRKSEKWSLLR